MDTTITPTVSAFCNCEYCTAARQESAALEADRGYEALVTAIEADRDYEDESSYEGENEDPYDGY